MWMYLNWCVILNYWFNIMFLATSSVCMLKVGITVHKVHKQWFAFSNDCLSLCSSMFMIQGWASILQARKAYTVYSCRFSENQSGNFVGQSPGIKIIGLWCNEWRCWSTGKCFSLVHVASKFTLSCLLLGSCNLNSIIIFIAPTSLNCVTKFKCTTWMINADE